MENKARTHVSISGRVQGVFFRMETKRAADGFGVFGWVKNQLDGTVEAGRPPRCGCGRCDRKLGRLYRGV